MFLLLLIVPLLIALGGFLFSIYHKDRRYIISLREFLIMIGAIVVVITVGYFASRMASTLDVEVWNGRVVNKKKEWTSCEHSYSCNCRQECSGSGNNINCSTVCDTCYEHFNDWNWVVYTTNNEKIHITRVDRQGTAEPPRFTQVKIGEPTALTHSYTNYIKGSPWSILKRQGLTERFKNLIPPYPQKIYNYHYLDRFLALKPMPSSQVQLWNKNLMEINADLGKKKQVNIIFIVVPTEDSSYLHALEEAWIGGKKNDLIVIIGTTNFPKIDWVRVMSWTRIEELKVSLQDSLENIGNLETREEIIKSVKEQVDRLFVRTPMRDFEYLMAGIQPPRWALIILLTVGLGLSAGLTIYFYKNDPFDSRKSLW